MRYVRSEKTACDAGLRSCGALGIRRYGDGLWAEAGSSRTRFSTKPLPQRLYLPFLLAPTEALGADPV